jgi:hypothetical protein
MGIAWREQSGDPVEQDGAVVARKVKTRLSCGHDKVIVAPLTSRD